MPCRIDVARETLGRLDAVPYAVEPRRERRGKGEVRIAVRSGNTAFDPEALVFPDDAKTCGAVVVTPCQPRRRPRGVHESLVRIDRGRVEHHHIRCPHDPAAQKPAEDVRACHRSNARVSRECVPAIPPQAEMDVAARPGAILRELRHERDGQAGLLGLSVTFMAKFAADRAGSSCHIHFSLWRDGRNAFAGDSVRTVNAQTRSAGSSAAGSPGCRT